MKKAWSIFILNQFFFMLGFNFIENVPPQLIVILFQSGIDEDFLSKNLLQNNICYKDENIEKKRLHSKNKNSSNLNRLNQWSNRLHKKQLNYLNKTTIEEIKHYYSDSKTIKNSQTNENKDFFVCFSENFERFLMINKYLKKVMNSKTKETNIKELRVLFHLLLNGKTLLISDKKIKKITSNFFAQYNKELVPVDATYNKVIENSEGYVELAFLVNSIESKILNKTYQNIALKLAVQKIFVIWYDLLDKAIKSERNLIES